MEKHLSQMELVSGICRLVEKQGFKNVTIKQLNAIVEGATLIVEKFHAPHIPATPGMGLHAWTGTDDVGASSKYMASVAKGMPTQERMAYPHDADDFSRCYKLIRATPELDWVTALPKIANHGGPVWVALWNNWKALEESYEYDISNKTAHCDELIREILRKSENKS